MMLEGSYLIKITIKGDEGCLDFIHAAFSSLSSALGPIHSIEAASG